MAASGSTTSPVRVVALGGLGEIGLNLMVLESGGQALVIDAGVMFPEERALGIDLVIPEMAYLASGRDRVVAVVLTHAHEDHIGALPFLLRHVTAPVYGTALTLALVDRRLRERGVAAELRTIAPRRRFSAGPFEIEPLQVTHSTPDSVALAIDTPAGLIVHSGDFKIDSAPVGDERFDHDGFARLGERGVAMLLSDSTNAEREGRAAPESSLRPLLSQALARTRGKFFLSSFSSHIHRLRQVAEISREAGRRVVPLGRRMAESVRVGIELGHLPLPPGTFIDPSEAMSFPPERLTFVAGGSQGEPLSALVKIAAETHPQVRVEAGDTVVLSSRSIPGNERRIQSMVNQLCRRGAEVLYEAVAPVHVSGHACRDELSELIGLTRPRYFVPIHGEYRHLARHLALAVQAGVAERNCFLLEDGQTLMLSAAGARRGAEVTAGRRMVDGAGLEDFTGLWRERLAMAREGTVMAVVVVSRGSGEILAGPDLVSCGLASGDGASQHIALARAELRRHLERTAAGVGWNDRRLKDEVVRALGRYFNQELGRRPVVVPWVMEV